MIEKILQFLLEKWEDRDSERMMGGTRDPGWNALMKAYKKAHPTCEATGTTKNLQVHHIKPVWLFPEDEMKWENLIILTRWIHFWLAHFGYYRSYNPDIRKDAAWLLDKIKNRP